MSKIADLWGLRRGRIYILLLCAVVVGVMLYRPRGAPVKKSADSVSALFAKSRAQAVPVPHASAIAVTSGDTTDFGSKIDEFLKKDDVCAYRKFMKLGEGDRVPSLAPLVDRILPKGHVASFVKQLLDQEYENAEIHDADFSFNTSLTERYLSASILADRSGEGSAPDQERALKILSTLKRDDPSNGAYPLMIARIYIDQGRSDREILAELTTAAQSNHYNSFVPTLKRALDEVKFSGNLTRKVLIEDIRNQIHEPYITPVRDYVERLVNQTGDTEALRKITHGLSRILVLDNQKNLDKPQGDYWIFLEYAIGTSFHGLDWELTHPGEKRPDIGLLKLRDQYRDHFKRLSGERPDGTCDPGLIRKTMDEDEAAFRKAMAR